MTQAINENNNKIVFPNLHSMRRYQFDIASKNGFCGKSDLILLTDIYKCVLRYSQKIKYQMSLIESLVIRQNSISKIRKERSDLLCNLSDSSCYHLLEQIENELSALPELCNDILHWMLSYKKTHRLHQTALLYQIWQDECKKNNVKDKVLLNQSIIEVLKDFNNWPIELKKIKNIKFRSTRWFEPFDEQCIIYLQKHIKIDIESCLPVTHSEYNAQNLDQKIVPNFQTNLWSGWLENLSDSFVINDFQLFNQIDQTNIDFSHSNGPYGEIEDLARRIKWFLATKECAPHKIAIVVPSMSLIDDIIPHVFGRFKLPYYFQHGRPVLSSPSIKAFLAWLSFPLNPKKEDLIDLILNPSLRFSNREHKIREYFSKPSEVNTSELDWVINETLISGLYILDKLNEWLVVDEDNHFNKSAVEQLQNILKEIGSRKFRLNQIVELIIDGLQNKNILPKHSKEYGIHILSMDDAIGSEFELVCFAALNEEILSSSIKQQAFLNDSERFLLRIALEDKNKALPAMALPNSSTNLKKRHICFLSALGMSKTQIVFSYHSIGSDGKEQNPNSYFRQLWKLAGWGNDAKPICSIYNNWRMQLTENNFLERYFKKQIQADFFDRKPMPGESFFSFIPLELCVSEDEAIQSILSDRDVIDLPNNNPHDFIFRNILIEKERQNYLSSSNENRFPSEYCGHLNQMIPFLNKKLNSFKKLSPTSLEELIRCRYLFLLKKVLDIRPFQLNDDFPNPLDRGSLIHNILQDIYESLQNGKSKIILSKAWLVNTNGKWKYSKTRNSKKSFPLLVLSKDKEKEILLYAETVTSYHIEMVNKQNQRFGYGNKTIWSIECEKILQSVRTILTQDINSADSTDPSYPVLFEYNFGKNNTESISLGGINLIGKIDRVDVSFNSENNHLQYIFILDYKGSNPHSKKLMIERIRNALDCQLLIYAFVIQKYLFNNFNKENLNNIMKIGYIPYNQNNSHKNKDFRKSVIALEEFPKLADEFIKTVEIYIECMKNGNFSTDPYHEMYDNYTSVVRNEMLKH